MIISQARPPETYAQIFSRILKGGVKADEFAELLLTADLSPKNDLISVGEGDHFFRDHGKRKFSAQKVVDAMEGESSEGISATDFAYGFWDTYFPRYVSSGFISGTNIMVKTYHDIPAARFKEIFNNGQNAMPRGGTLV